MKETTAWTLQTMIAAAALIGVLHMARGCEADRQSTLARAAEQCIASGGTWISPDCARCGEKGGAK